MKIYTKEMLIEEFRKISKLGFIENQRNKNAGGIGNTLEDLLGIEENNLPIPNANEWELKAQRLNTTSLTTLFHIEPSPRAIKFVPEVFLKKYGWKHDKAGLKYPIGEMSFRQTISAANFTSRGFTVVVDRKFKKVKLSFNKNKVDKANQEWLDRILLSVGDGDINPEPYWGFDDLEHKAGSKLSNCFYVQANVKKDGGKEFYHYCKLTMLEKFDFAGFLNQLEASNILIDVDARTGHNHGTKFRMRQNALQYLYNGVTNIEI